MTSESDKKAKTEVVEQTKPVATKTAANRLKITNITQNVKTLIDENGNGIYLQVNESVELDVPVSKDIRRVERLGFVQIEKL